MHCENGINTVTEKCLSAPKMVVYHNCKHHGLIALIFYYIYLHIKHRIFLNRNETTKIT